MESRAREGKQFNVKDRLQVKKTEWRKHGDRETTVVAMLRVRPVLKLGLEILNW